MTSKTPFVRLKELMHNTRCTSKIFMGGRGGGGGCGRGRGGGGGGGGGGGVKSKSCSKWGGGGCSFIK